MKPLKYRNGMNRRQPCPQSGKPLSTWPTCPEHEGTPVRWTNGWVYCKNVGWHPDKAMAS